MKFKNAGTGGVKYSTLVVEKGADIDGYESKGISFEMECKYDGIDGSVILNVDQLEKLVVALTAFIKANKPKLSGVKMVEGVL